MAKIVLFILFVILATTFATLNRQEISLHYFFGWDTGPFPVFLLILISLVAGLGVGLGMSWRDRRRLRAMGRDLGKQIEVLKEQIENLTPKEEKAKPTSETPGGENASS